MADGQRIKTRTGSPTPDDLDDLIAKVWKEPGFFIASWQLPRLGERYPPRSAATYHFAFRLTVLTWRGILIPSDKLPIVVNQDHSFTHRRIPPGGWFISARFAG